MKPDINSLLPRLLYMVLACLCLAFPGVARAQTNLLSGDVVFVIDESGSMSPYIQQVRNQVAFIAGELSRSIDVRFGLVGFGATASHRPGVGDGQPHIHSPVTDVSGFQRALGELVASGGFEPGLSASVTAVSDAMNLRRGASVCVVLITDEDADDPQNLSAAIAALRDRNATWFGVVSVGDGNTAATYGPNAGSLAATTGGGIFSIYSFNTNARPVLDALLEKCVSKVVQTSPLTTAGAPSSNAGVPYSFDPVNLVTGNYVLQSMDLAIPGRGLPLIVQRTYNSIDSSETSLGVGWRLNLHSGLAVAAGGDIVVVTGDGRRDFYARQADGTYVAPAGIQAQLTTTADGGYRLEDKDRTRLFFGGDGRLLQIVDRNDNALVLSYDQQGRLRQLTDTVGRTATLSYDANNRLIGVSDAIGRSVAYAYNAEGLLSAVSDLNGEITSYGYDGKGRLATITDALGQRSVLNEYDGAGRVVRQTDARGGLTTIVYDPANQNTRETDALGRTTIHHYNDRGLLVRRMDALSAEYRFTYDEDNQRTSATDPNGNVNTFRYDARGNLTAVTDALGAQVRLAYDGSDNLTRVIDALGRTIAFTYDARGNLLSADNGAGGTTAFAYDQFGQLIQITDARGNVTRYGFDDHGNVATLTNALGHSAALQHDAVGRLIGVTDPLGSFQAADYDPIGRLTAITDALGHRWDFLYDAVGRLTEVQDPRGSATRYAYDPNDNLTEVADALGHVTRYVYDAVNNRTGIIDANGNATTVVFDAVNRLAEIIDPLGNRRSYGYDPAGRPLALTDANGATTGVVYDASGRILELRYADGRTVSYGYDAAGQRTAMTDDRGTTTYAYDTVGRPIRIAHPDGTVGYAYDAAGNRVALTYPDGRTVTYGYDALNRLARVSDWDGATTGYSFDAAGRLIGIAYPNTMTATLSYDAAGRLTELAHLRRGMPLERFCYLLDAAGNRIEIQRKRGGPSTLVHKYTYDALSQLVGTETWRDGPPSERTRPDRFAYAYDAVGNRLSRTHLPPPVPGRSPIGTETYEYDAANRLLRAGDTVFTYDANGNRLTEAGATGQLWRYGFDAADRLVEVIKGPVPHPGVAVVRYAYDGDGNKVREDVIRSGRTQSVTFLSDVTAALPVTLLQSSAGETTAFTRGFGLLARERRTGGSNRGSDAWYHPDGLGSTALITGEGGSSVAAYRYDPWGNLEENPRDTAGNRFLFTGEERSPHTGLYYLRARWYDPATGVFVSRDPYAGQATIPASLHRYQYVRNQPINFIDPSGLTRSADEGATNSNEIFADLNPACGVFCRATGRFLLELGFELRAQQFLFKPVARNALQNSTNAGRVLRAANVAKTTITLGVNLVALPVVNYYLDDYENPQKDPYSKAAGVAFDVGINATTSLVDIGLCGGYPCGSAAYAALDAYSIKKTGGSIKETFLKGAGDIGYRTGKFFGIWD